MAQPTSSKAYDLAINPSFQRRVKFFMHKAATAVIGEVAGATIPRADYATAVLNGSASVDNMSIAVTTNPTISAAINMAVDDMGITDSDLEFTVNSMWDDFSRKDGAVV